MPRWIGPALVGAGALVAVVGIAGMLGGESSVEAAASTSTTVVNGTTTVPAASTTSASTTTVQQTTSTSTSTTTAPDTTTTTQPAETVEAFIETFAAALEAGDNEYVFARLHPVAVNGWGVELCSSWVDREIMALSDYTLITVKEGPVTKNVTTPNGEDSVPNYFTASVSFGFQGATFESDSGFASIGGDMYWLGQCR